MSEEGAADVTISGNPRLKWMIAAALALLLLAFAAWRLLFGDSMRMERINEHLDADGIRIGMAEQEVVRLWGQGEFVEGFGGNGRIYPDRHIRVSFPNDSDNDLHKRVSQLSFTNAGYSLFGVKVGDRREDAIAKISAERFRVSEDSPNIFVNGEYNIMLSGSPNLSEIAVWFADKDLRDRNY